MGDKDNSVAKIKFITFRDDCSVLPKAATYGSCGFDLIANFDEEQIIIEPMKRACIGTGIAIEIPSGFSALVCPRSGLALNHGVTVLNSPGVIDNDYRGEVKVILINFGDKQFLVNKGMRIAQMLILKSADAYFEQVKQLSQTRRQDKGFGSTG